MGVALAWLVSRLRNTVPARNGIPDEDGYEQCVRDAVADFGRRKPAEKIINLSIVSGTAAYALPADFLRLTAVESMATTDAEVIISDAGIIPIDASWQERWTVAGQTITFYPTPTYTKARDVWYQALYVLDDDEEYADLTDEDARTVLLYAQALALQQVANGTAGSGWRYQIGDEMVDKSSQGKQLRDQADWLETKYLDAIKAAHGQIGRRGSEPQTRSV